MEKQTDNFNKFLFENSPGLDLHIIDRPAKKQDTKEILINAGEHLLGQKGVAGFSLREVALFAGLNSNNIVQYHFGNKKGLITAILNNRAERMMAFRKRLAEEMLSSSLTVRGALLLLWLPRMSFKDSEGCHPFCRFLLQLCVHPNVKDYPLMRYYDEAVVGHQSNLEQTDQYILQALDCLRAHYSHLSETTFEQRLAVLNLAHLTSVVSSDTARKVKATDIEYYDMDFMVDFAVGTLSGL